MAVFLNEPRYALGCLGFYTESSSGRRILRAGVLLTALAVIAALVGGISSEKNSSGAQALFLIISAWVMIFGLMRLFLTGAMWIFTLVFELIAEGVPTLSSAMHFLRHAYWIVIEVFLSTAFLGMLTMAILTGFGRLSLNDEEAEQVASFNHYQPFSFGDFT